MITVILLSDIYISLHWKINITASTTLFGIQLNYLVPGRFHYRWYGQTPSFLGQCIAVIIPFLKSLLAPGSLRQSIVLHCFLFTSKHFRPYEVYPLYWRHSGPDGVSNHQLHDCLLSRLFRRISKKTSKLRVTGLCAGSSPVTGEFPAQMTSYAGNVTIRWRHHSICHPKRKTRITQSMVPLWNAIECHCKYRRVIFAAIVYENLCHTLASTSSIIYFSLVLNDHLVLLVLLWCIVYHCTDASYCWEQPFCDITFKRRAFYPNKMICNFTRLGEKNGHDIYLLIIHILYIRFTF